MLFALNTPNERLDDSLKCQGRKGSSPMLNALLTTSLLAPLSASTNCTFGYQTNRSCVGSEVPRDAWLQCLYDSHIVPHHDSNYEEWDPSLPCKAVDGYNITVGQPKNAISSFAFDALACRDGNSLEQSASLMGFGSYAFHAKGGAEWTKHLDRASLACIAVSLLARANTLSNTSQLIHDVRVVNHTYENYTFDVEALANGPMGCTKNMSSALQKCDHSGALGDHQNSSALYDAIRELDHNLPEYQNVYMRVAVGANRYCYGNEETEAFTKFFEVLSKISQLAPFPKSIENFTFANPRPIRAPHDYLPPNGFCYNLDRFLVKFTEAAAVQGEFFPSIFPQRHDLWHIRSAEALGYALDAFATW